MILNYTESSAFATEIAKYMMLSSMALIIFLWAFENIKRYFHWGIENTEDLLSDIRDELVTVNDHLSDPTPAELVIS